MAKPIDAELLEPDAAWDEHEDGFTAYSRVQIDNAPVIIVEAVKHGRFVFEKGDNKTTVDGWICTNCKTGFHTRVPYFEVFKYCPMCGARMDAKQPKSNVPTDAEARARDDDYSEF